MITVIAISLATTLCLLGLYTWKPWNCFVCEKRSGWFSNPGRYTDGGPICSDCIKKGQ